MSPSFLGVALEVLRAPGQTRCMQICEVGQREKARRGAKQRRNRIERSVHIARAPFRRSKAGFSVADESRVESRKVELEPRCKSLSVSSWKKKTAKLSHQPLFPRDDFGGDCYNIINLRSTEYPYYYIDWEAAASWWIYLYWRASLLWSDCVYSGLLQGAT